MADSTCMIFFESGAAEIVLDDVERWLTERGLHVLRDADAPRRPLGRRPGIEG